MIKLIPQPSFVDYSKEKALKIESIYFEQNTLSQTVVDDFFDFVKISQGGQTAVQFVFDESFGKEEYQLLVDEKITITYSANSGAVYALQTLKQLLYQFENTLPYLLIKDKPQKEIRGFMLDVGRYFFSVEDVKRIIKRMALHKLNFFHFHLTEDQGWRVEIEKYPLLTEIGSKRDKTNYNRREHSGFYTKNDIKEIVSFAHDFGISVMPEFDIPGHSRSAMAGYSWLGCFDRELPVANHWGVKYDVLCAGKDSTYEFVENVIDEMCEMFPDEYFHIGGDEVPKHRWSLCPHCQQKIKELGLKDEEEFQCYFMNKVKEYCKLKGKKVFMWSWDLKNEECIDDDLGFTKCTDSFTGDRPFIDTSTKAYYIDLPYGDISLKETANHKMYDGNCLGVEATLWTEYVPDMKKADKMSFPRLGAMAETGWAGQCSWQLFSEKLEYYYGFLDKNGIGYSKEKTANPSSVKGALQKIWFEKRQLTWQGITNIFDDKKVENIAKSK